MTYGVNLQNLRVVCHGDVDQLGDVLRRCRLANQKPYLLKGVGHPRKQNQEGDEDGTNGIKVPNVFGADHSHDKTKTVDGDIVSVVDLWWKVSMARSKIVGLTRPNLRRTRGPTGAFCR
jgi:hypothetical protein